MWLLTGHDYAKRFGVRNDEGSSAFARANTPSNLSRFSGRNGQTRSLCQQGSACRRAEIERQGVCPPIDSQQGRRCGDTLSRPRLRPQRAWATRACSEVLGGVHPPRRERDECADDESERLIPTPPTPYSRPLSSAEKCHIGPGHEDKQAGEIRATSPAIRPPAPIDELSLCESPCAARWRCTAHETPPPRSLARRYLCAG